MPFHKLLVSDLIKYRKLEIPLCICFLLRVMDVMYLGLHILLKCVHGPMVYKTLPFKTCQTCWSFVPCQIVIWGRTQDGWKGGGERVQREYPKRTLATSPSRSRIHHYPSFFLTLFFYRLVCMSVCPRNLVSENVFCNSLPYRTGPMP